MGQSVFHTADTESLCALCCVFHQGTRTLCLPKSIQLLSDSVHQHFLMFALRGLLAAPVTVIIISIHIYHVTD